MKKKIGKCFTVLSMVGLLASCAQMERPLEAQYANPHRAENARTYNDHDNLAKQYENTAKELLVKAEERKKLLQHYEEKSYLYGKQAQDRQSHIWALILKHEKAAKISQVNAASHRKIAAELEWNSYGSSRQVADTTNKPAARSN